MLISANHFLHRSALALLMGLLLLLPLAATSADAKSQSFAIYFDREISNLTPEAADVAGVVAKALKPNAHVTFVDHSDTAEPAPDKLSLARALAVEEAVVAGGVPPPGVTLTISGVGTSAPAAPTGPKVSEPLNRFVGVTIQ